MDSIGFNITAIDTSLCSTTVTMKISLLSCTIFNTRARECQSISIREVPDSRMGTLISTTTCAQVSVTLNTVTTTVMIPHLTDVHPGVVSQSLSHEGEIRDSVLGEGQRPEERDNQQCETLMTTPPPPGKI